VKPDDFTGMSPKAFDLAQLPFANDAAAQELMDQYGLDGNLPESTLYSPQDKEMRQEIDAFAGIPAAPDAEYAAADKSIPPASKASRSYGTPQRTQIGNLQSGSVAGGGGGVRSSTTWNPSNLYDKGKDGGNKTGISKADADKLKATQAGRALLATAGGVAEAAKKGSAEDLAKVFQGGKSAEDVARDIDKTVLPSDGLKAGGPGGGPSLSDLADAAKPDDNKKDDKKDDKECKNFGMCLLQDFAKDLLNAFVDVGKQWLMNKLGGNNSAIDNSKYCVAQGREAGKSYNTDFAVGEKSWIACMKELGSQNSDNNSNLLRCSQCQVLCSENKYLNPDGTVNHTQQQESLNYCMTHCK